jgi:drug/metabolite transporter (DMT)-like permease
MASHGARLAIVRHPSRAAVVAAFAAIYLLWGSTYLAIRFAVETIPPFLMAGTRHLAAGVILYAYARRKGAPPPTARNWKAAAAIGALLLLGGNGLVSWAETRMASGPAALIVASVPLWMVALSAAAERRRPPTAVIAGVAAALGGIALLVLPHRSGDAVPLLPAAALVVAALSWSVGSLWSRRASLPKETLLATAMEALAGGAILWIAGLAFGEGAGLDFRAVTFRSVAALAYLVVFGSVVGFSSYVWLLKVAAPERVSTYAFVNPIVAVVLGIVLGGEVLTLRIALAGAAVIGAVSLILVVGARRRSRPAEAPLRRAAAD